MNRTGENHVVLNSIQDRNIERPCDPEINSRRSVRFAFTLAEVLITLGIIGIVAEMTIPTLMNNVQDKIFKVAYKTAYASASQAVLSANAQGLFNFVPAGEDPSIRSNWLVFMDQFKVAKKCTDSNCFDCWNSDGEVYAPWHATTSTNYSFIDASGMSWASRVTPTTAETYFFVDTNGFKKPNQYGKDRFAFFMLDFDGTTSNYNYGTPAKIVPFLDDTTGSTSCCHSENKCNTTHDYFGTSWLYN